MNLPQIDHPVFYFFMLKHNVNMAVSRGLQLFSTVALTVELVNGGTKLQSTGRVYYTWDIRAYLFVLGLVFLLIYYKRYRVTIQLVQNLPLTSKPKFSFGLARPVQSRPKRNFCF